MRTLIIIGNLVILLIFFNDSIFEKESILSDGKLVLLELAPVDPRSLMQGDYMSLRYKIAVRNDDKNISKRGYFVIHLEPNGIANRIRIQENPTPINKNEFLIKYFSTNRNLNIGAESFFFQEGQSEKFAEAKYGGIKVDDQGNSVLIGLYNENLKMIE